MPEHLPRGWNWGYRSMTTVKGLFTAGDGVGASGHKFSSGSHAEGRMCAKSMVKYCLDNKDLKPELDTSVEDLVAETSSGPHPPDAEQRAPPSGPPLPGCQHDHEAEDERTGLEPGRRLVCPRKPGARPALSASRLARFGGHHHRACQGRQALMLPAPLRAVRMRRMQ